MDHFEVINCSANGGVISPQAQARCGVSCACNCSDPCPGIFTISWIVEQAYFGSNVSSTTSATPSAQRDFINQASAGDRLNNILV